MLPAHGGRALQQGSVLKSASPQVHQHIITAISSPTMQRPSQRTTTIARQSLHKCHKPVEEGVVHKESNKLSGEVGVFSGMSM